jgi:mannose-6-phosphate isomerase
MLYPLFFEPVYKNIIWGGRNLETVFNRILPPGEIAESWDVCCHKNGMSIVSNGSLKGKSLEELIKLYSLELLGKKCVDMDRFPVLVKIIDANDKLSVQVHPGDEYALKDCGDLGKTEMWYIIDAKPNSRLVYGTLPGISKEEFRASITDGSLQSKLRYINVVKGDVIFIPVGTVHAIMEGLVIAEIQQNSDTTYRVFDWNRTDAIGNQRELHVEKALDVINFNFEGKINKPIEIKHSGYSEEKLISCEYFKVDKIIIDSIYEDKTDNYSLYIYTVLAGDGYLVHNNVEYDILKGASFIIPAALGKFEIKGNLTLLKTYL